MTTTPQVLFDPALLAEIEAALQEGETLTGFVEASVRSAVEYRRMQTSFHMRGQAVWDRYPRTGAAIPANEVLAELRGKLDEKRKQLGG